MPVPTDIGDLSPTPGSNSPSGSESPATFDNYMRTFAAFMAQLRDGKQSTGASVLLTGAQTVAGVKTFTDGIVGTATNVTGIVAVANGGTGVSDGSGLAQPGDIKLTARSTAPSGWLKANGTTIGNASSGATGRANADTEALFTVLWNDHGNTILPIQTSTGIASTRGASAAADFAANKRLPLHDLRGEFFRGLDDGRGVDTGRVLGTAQVATGVDSASDNNGTLNVTNPDSTTVLASTTGFSTTGSTRAVNRHTVRPRNVAMLVVIKL